MEDAPRIELGLPASKAGVITITLRNHLVATGFEPAKHNADDLESPSFDHLDTLPFADFFKTKININIIIHY